MIDRDTGLERILEALRVLGDASYQERIPEPVEARHELRPLVVDPAFARC